MKSFELAIKLIVVGMSLQCCGPAQDLEVWEGSVQRDDFSSVGQFVFERLGQARAAGYGKTWGVSGDNAFDSDWIQQTPLATYWGLRTQDLPVVLGCGVDEAYCDIDFGLRTCERQQD